jgi:4-alpha-glucanotransferase
VSKESHEVYFHPNLFDLKYEAGAPPDAFAADGQNWGQPIYNWKEHEKEHFRFFRQRVSVLEQFFDYYRIDHTIGFFRFWQIPNSKKGSEGFFSSCDPEEYLPQAKKRLKALLQHTRIKPIAEDLGTKPFGMEKTLEELHIPGMKVLRWEEDPDVFPIQSLSTVSLHDTTLMASWFRQENGRGIQDDERVALLKTSLKAPSIFKVNLLQEYLALEERYRYAFDEMEQINIPSTVLPTNWSIRMKGSLEDLKENRHLALKIKTLIDSGYDQ